MKKGKIALTAAGLVIVAAVGAYLITMDTDKSTDPQSLDAPQVTVENGKTVKSFELVAEESNWELGEGKEVAAWTYNGTVPGSQIRVKQGEIIRVQLKNKLKQPVSIHWHGYPVPNSMDGIPGMTQNAVRPGESFRYEFEATVPGTYWYHSHQDSSNQVDKGLYGTLIVEGNDEKALNRDYTLVLDEWMENGDTGEGMDHGSMSGRDHEATSKDNKPAMDHSMAGMDHGNMSGMDHGATSKDTNTTMDHSMTGMDHGKMSMPNQQAATQQNGTETNLPPGAMHDEMMKMMYTTFTVNGKSGNAIQPLSVAKGERVRLRFVNAGYQSHLLSLQHQPYQIVSVDGQQVEGPQLIKSQPLRIAPGERYDVEFTVTEEQNWSIDSLDEAPAAKQMTIPIQVKGAKASEGHKTPPTNEPAVDLSMYGTREQSKFNLDMKYDINYTMDLGEKPGKTQMDAVFTINGKSYDEVPPLTVKKGDKILVTMKNVGSSDHPMHLHGHFFQVLSKDNIPFSGSPIMKDTLNVKPKETYVVAFEADNPGDWMFHCHDLHHAAAGMVSEVKYAGFKSFIPDPTVGNKPE